MSSCTTGLAGKRRPSPGYSGHVDGKPSDARFNHPKGVTMDDKGNIYAADTSNLAIRKIGESGYYVLQVFLNEFAVKMHLLRPTYSVVGGLLPIFISSLVFNGKTYVESPTKTKKEAEQKAARAAIQSILGFPPLLMHKNRLQEYAQRSALPLPVYQTINEGPPHDPIIRSAVTVDGATHKSARIFQNRKAAE